MKSVYKRENVNITKFEKEDIIATFGEPVIKGKKENRYFTFHSFDSSPGNWF